MSRRHPPRPPLDLPRPPLRQAHRALTASPAVGATVARASVLGNRPTAATAAGRAKFSPVPPDPLLLATGPARAAGGLDPSRGAAPGARPAFSLSGAQAPSSAGHQALRRLSPLYGFEASSASSHASHLRTTKHLRTTGFGPVDQATGPTDRAHSFNRKD